MEASKEFESAKIMAIWSVILLLGIFSFSLFTHSRPVNLLIFPEVPREDEPIVVLLQLQNPESHENPYQFKLYKDGKLVTSGRVKLGAHSSKSLRYAYINDLALGDRMVFLAEVQTPRAIYREEVSLPAYPPQVWSSFVSFASFSTSMAGVAAAGSMAGMASTSVSSSMGISSMTTMTTMAYYKGHFGTGTSFNVGVVFSIVLIAILIHIEVTEPFRDARNYLSRLRKRFSRLSAILFIIFAAMVLTQVVLIIS
jgi:hypothetical protein